MAEGKGKQVSARIKDSKVWDRFIEYVNNKHGKVFGFTGLELEKALIYYLENPEGAASLHNIEKKHDKTINQMQDEINKLNHELKDLQDLKSKYEKLLNDYDKLGADRNYWNALYTQSLEKLNDLQNDLHIYENGIVKIDSNYSTSKLLLDKMSLLDRIRRRYPESLEIITQDLHDLKMITGKSESPND